MPRGDTTAIEQAAERYRPVLITLAETLIATNYRGELEASDLVQQTLLEAFRDREQVHGASDQAVFAWLRKILHHNTLDAIVHLKTQKRNVDRKKREADIGSTFARLDDILASDQTSPSQIVERNEQLTLLLETVQTLPGNQRMAIMMKHLRGWTLRQISDELRVTESAVAGLLHRGRQTLSQVLREDRDEPPRE